MDKCLQELFDYCNIPKAGRKIISDDFDLKTQAIEGFSKDNDSFKYLNPISLACRFFFDTKEIEYLYHFLPISDAVNIIKSRTFYIGNQNDMNDPLEKNFVWYKCRDYLKNFYKSQYVLEIFDSLKHYALENMLDTYVWSFTTGKNTHLLHNYGQAALEINASLTYKKLNINNHIFPAKDVLNVVLVPGVYPIKVCYDESVQNDYIFHLADYFFELINKYDDVETCKYLIHVLTFYMLVFKGKSWSKENEYRFLIARPIIKNKKSYDYLFNNKPKIKGSIEPSNLVSILINKEKMESVDFLKHVLMDNGFEDVTISKV